jgi:uridylate kinase
MEYLTVIYLFLQENAVVLGGGAAVVAIVGGGWAVVARPFRREQKVGLTEEAIERIGPRHTDLNPQLTTAEFIRIRRDMKADLEVKSPPPTPMENNSLPPPSPIWNRKSPIPMQCWPRH